MSADLERDSKGNEHLHATVRDHTGIQTVIGKNLSPKAREHKSLAHVGKSHGGAGTVLNAALAPGHVVSDHEAAKKDKKKRKVKEKEKENGEIAEEIEEGVKDVVEDVLEKHNKKEKRRNVKEPIYRVLGGTGLPPPKSESELLMVKRD